MNPPRVLIVDDNAMNIELAAFVLRAASVTVASAADAGGALRQLASFRPDIILMDIQMPGINGVELTRTVKADPATAHIVVVAFTAYAMKGDDAKLRAVGCDGYISKPINVASFAATVRSYASVGDVN